MDTAIALLANDWPYLAAALAIGLVTGWFSHGGGKG